MIAACLNHKYIEMSDLRETCGNDKAGGSTSNNNEIIRR